MTSPIAFHPQLSRAELDAGAEKPARLAVIGHPVAHSASPRMHQAALDALGLNLRYVALEVAPGQLAAALDRLRTLDFLGVNVTIPHKFDALAACDEIDATARALGAVNTIRFDSGRALGTNTDGYGFEQAVRESLGLELRGTTVLIVGAGGGAGTALAAHCALAGVPKLVLINRTVSKIDELALRLRALAPATEVVTSSSESPNLIDLARSCGLLVNTSSLGLKADDPSPLPPSCFTPAHFAFDSIYGAHRTPFIMSAEAAGARAADGRLMLLHQGVRAFEIWFPGTRPAAFMRRGLGV